MAQKIPLNTLLDTMIMMLSDHYAWSFHKWLAVLEGNTTMSFKISDNKLLKKYNRIWKRVEKLLKIEFDSKPVHGDNDKCIKAKIKIYGVTVNANFRDKKMPKVKAPCKFLSIILLDSVVKVKKKTLSSNTFGGMQIWTKNNKNGKPYWWWFRKKFVWWVR